MQVAHQIVIQATRTTNWAHDVAIDDVRLYNCSYDDIELSTDVTSVTDHIGSSPAAIKTTTPGHVTRHITDSTTPDKILTENSTKDNVTQTPSGGKSPNSSNDQNDFKIQKSTDPDIFTHFISENVSIANWAKTGTKHVVRSSRTPMSKNELYTLYTGIIVTVVIILLLLLTILVGVQVQWRKKRVPRDQTNEEVIEMETLKEYKVNMDPTDTTCSTKESASDNLISEHAPHNENVIFCTRL
ncbi:uncharacterized protein LOC117336307 isoform X2 [Pecten maximus]|uniref:uncharacterized protein LOC117336307 isoform X2 n=1 Tax=Pecten maximus TaxID=6579 RepID=UPI001458C384|nr:uncharacterized protein LOC117336307 isoform X2 [Pecten maximus]